MSTVHTTVQLHTTLWEGDVTERVTYQLYNRNITIDKLPRTLLDKYKEEDELQFSGIYFPTNSSVDNPRIYVGQAAKRIDGNGLMGRIREDDRQKDFWDTAYLIAPTDNSWEATDLNYLESAFCRLAQKANHYRLENINIPVSRNITKTKNAILCSLIHEVLLMLHLSGHYMFEPHRILKGLGDKPNRLLNEVEVAENTHHVIPPATIQSDKNRSPGRYSDYIFCLRRGKGVLARAKIVLDSDGKKKIEVFSGKILKLANFRPGDQAGESEERINLLESIAEARYKNEQAGNLKESKIINPINFPNPTDATNFILGGVIGKNDWVLESNPNVSLKEILKRIETKQN